MPLIQRPPLDLGHGWSITPHIFEVANTITNLKPHTTDTPSIGCSHDDVIKWKTFPRYWPFVREIHRPPVNSPHKGQWRGALMFSLICVWINSWVNNREAGDLRRYGAHYDVIVIYTPIINHAGLVCFVLYWWTIHCRFTDFKAPFPSGQCAY